MIEVELMQDRNIPSDILGGVKYIIDGGGLEGGVVLFWIV
jgi:hypothetical protein